MKRFFKLLLSLTGLKVYYYAIKDKYQGKSDKYSKMMEFYSQFLEPRDLVFDVGANLGNRSDVFLGLGMKVVAVEPQNYCNKYLRVRFGKKIKLVNRALGSEMGKAIMYTGEHHYLSTISKLWKDKVSKSNRFLNVNWNKTQEVIVTTLENLIQEYGKPKFVKIDVEGFELEVLYGLKTKIDYISFEYTIPEFTQNAIKSIEYLKSIGNFECNYSIGESMVMSLDQWVEPDFFIKIIVEDIEINAVSKGFGDIYVKFVG